jgi:hypothetical protein
MLGSIAQSSPKRLVYRWLKAIAVAAFWTFFSSLAAPANQSVSQQGVALGWDSTPDPGVTGYVLYYGTNTGNYFNRLDVGSNTTTAVSSLTEGQTYFFAVTAYNAQKVESDLSNEVSYLVPGALRLKAGTAPADPVRISFSAAPGHNYAIQATEDFRSWITILETSPTTNSWVEFVDPEAASQPMRFYRLASY